MSTELGSSIFEKLEGFIRKYYKNQIIKGAIISISLLLALYLFVVTLEYFGKYSSVVRLTLLLTYLVTSVFVLISFILLPLASLIKLKNRLSLEMASRIIGSHFEDVEDKLLNTLQLNGINEPDNSLILASIEQKTKELRPIDFRKAIDYKRNRKYLKFLIPIFIVFLGTAIMYPGLIQLGTKRIVQYNKVFKNVFPFAVYIDNPLEGVIGEDYLLSFHLEGNELPKDVFIEFDNKRYRAESANNHEYSFVFNNLRESQEFKIIADDKEYDMYSISAIAKPRITQINVVVDYPDYLNMQDEVITNPADVTLPSGTRLSWNIKTDHCNSLKLYSKDSIYRYRMGDNNFRMDFKIYESEILSFVPYSDQTGIGSLVRDSLSTNINVIPDLYPSIEVVDGKDSVFLSLIDFNGSIKDDYGLRSLNFHYSIERVDGESQKQSVNIPISGNQLMQKFKFPFDTKMLGMRPGDKMIYYFEVFDNDGVRGPKSTKSLVRTFRIPTENEIKEGINNRNESIKNDLSASKEMSDDLKKDIDDLKKSLLQKKNLSWDDKKKMNDLLEKQKDLKDKIDNVNQQNDINKIQDKELDDEKRILDKQEEINKLFDDLENDELNKLMDDLEKMMDKMDKNKLMDMLDKMEMSNDDLEKELDRTLELFKQMQFENKISDALEKIDDLLKEQEKFLKDMESKEDVDKLKDQQDFIDEKMKELEDDLKELNDLNKDMENQQDMGELNDKMEDMKDEMNNSKNELEKGQKSKSSKSMDNSKKKTEEMKDAMEGMQSQMESGQSGENLEDLRQLLDNTLKLSFDQEKLIKSTQDVNINNPQFKNILKEQKKLIDDSKVIEDSLLALSKRVIQIESMVNREISQVKGSMQKSLDFLEARDKANSADKQHYALTSLNNLALMLSEAIQQMQQQMQQQSQSSPGNKSCNKPGQGSKPMEGLLQRQMALQQKLENMKGRMEGKSPQSGGDGEISKDLVKLANEQESIRKELQDLSKDLEGDQKRQINDIIKKMEENEYDILNKRISSGTVKRNEDITIKLMDSEKALRNQDQDEKRKSNEGEDKEGLDNKLIEDYFRKKAQEIEIIRTIPPVMRPYYKSKVSQYLNNF